MPGEESDLSAAAHPKIVWSTTDNTRHETGGSEGCFGVSTGSSGADLFALSPNVVAITFPEYGCKGQPSVAVCGFGVAERLQKATMRMNQMEEGEDDDTVDPAAVAQPSTSCAAPASVGPQSSCAPKSQSAGQTMSYDSFGDAFRGTALQRPNLKTLGCTAETASIQYTSERASSISDASRFALEQYSSFKSLRMPEPAVAKSVFLARVDSLGTIPAVQSVCAPAQAPAAQNPATQTLATATQAAPAAPCPETPDVPLATETAPAVMITPISGVSSPPAQKLTLECPTESANQSAGTPAPMTTPAMNSAPKFLPGPVIISVSPPEMNAAPTSRPARSPGMGAANP